MELNRPPGDDDTAPQRAVPRWFRRESVSLAELAVQTFSVVLGILLALGIDDWKRDREPKQNVDDAMQAVRTEIVADVVDDAYAKAIAAPGGLALAHR